MALIKADTGVLNSRQIPGVSCKSKFHLNQFFMIIKRISLN